MVVAAYAHNLADSPRAHPTLYPEVCIMDRRLTFQDNRRYLETVQEDWGEESGKEKGSATTRSYRVT